MCKNKKKTIILLLLILFFVIMIFENLKKFKNIYIWIISFLLAILLWFSIALNKKYDYLIKIPIYYKNIPSDMMFSKEPPKTISLHIQENGRKLLKMILNHQLKNIKVEVNLLNPKLGKNIIILKKDNILFPSKITRDLYYYTVKNRLVLYLDPKSVKSVPINTNITLNIPNGFVSVLPPKFEPLSVNVSGPISNLKKIKILNLDLKNLPVLDDTVQIRASIKIPSYYNVFLSEKYVKLKLCIQKESYKVVTDIPVKIINVPAKMSKRIAVVPQNVSIEVSGGVDVLKYLSKKDFNVFVNFDNVDSLNLEYPAAVNVFKNINSFKTFPEKFKIILKGLEE